MKSRLSRREFIRRGGVVTAGAAVVGCSDRREDAPADRERAPDRPADAHTADAHTVDLPYPNDLVTARSSLVTGVPVTFHYPDPASPCVLLKTGRPVPGGVGPDNDIVAFSSLCTHQGCGVAYDANASTLKCHCHFSIFDPERDGQVVCGQATVPLPRVQLRYDDRDDSVRAVGVRGLIYGRTSNLLA